jgi:hypothetical protein
VVSRKYLALSCTISKQVRWPPGTVSVN